MNSYRKVHCQICGRAFDNAADPLSANCGGDCWGCMGEIEANIGDVKALYLVRKEHKLGFRPSWIDPDNK